MRVYDVRNARGEIAGFEVKNWLLGRPDVCVIVRRAGWPIRSCDLRPIGANDVFCEFDVDGEAFIATDDWGESDRYWIGTRNVRPSEKLALVRKVFAETRPPVWPSVVRGIALGAIIDGSFVLIVATIILDIRWILAGAAPLAVGWLAWSRFRTSLSSSESARGEVNCGVRL